MCSLSGFDLVWFLILQNFMEYMEVQYVLVMSLIRFFASWAIVLGQSCFLVTWRFLESKCQKCMYIFNFVCQYSCTHLCKQKRVKRGSLVENIPKKKRVKRGFLKNKIYAFRGYFSIAIYAFRGVFQNPCSSMGTKLKPELPPPPPGMHVIAHQHIIKKNTREKKSNTACT